ncbi:MAG: amidohydrolase [Nitrospinae bacterium CG11_big_fil_rev_8_21_14_0_20_56_8]|nr:MAG: amidohydrolase [Nitrospinae bacterium CG11_big_fil_rev_8_21_14_0_20_56_8]
MEPMQRRILFLFLLAGLTVSLSAPSSCTRLGGDVLGPPEALESHLTPQARALIEKAYEGIDPARLTDFHTHLLGQGGSGSGIYLNPDLQSLWHPLKYLRYSVFREASGIQSDLEADREYVERLRRLVEALPVPGRFLLLAFDAVVRPDGTPDWARTEFYIPNAYAAAVASADPTRFIPMISVHPYRKDALERLESWRARGVRFIKWLPNAMGMDPADPRVDDYYRKVRELDMVILAHAGKEQAVEGGDFEPLGNPLRLRRPLGLGVRVVVAHCASLGMGEDLDAGDGSSLPNFDLFLRLMREKQYEGLLFGDISGLTQENRFDGPLQTLLADAALQKRLINGSDYPLPALNVVIWTRSLEAAGFITGQEREALNLIYGYNPLLFDFILKRTLRHPPTGATFALSVFHFPPELDPRPPSPASPGGNR